MDPGRQEDPHRHRQAPGPGIEAATFMIEVQISFIFWGGGAGTYLN